jgi:transposase
MGKAITIIQHHTQEELEKEIKRTKDGRYRLRIQTILLAMRKMSAHAIQKQLMISNLSIFRWAKWYNNKGLEGIKEVSKGGRAEGNPKWDNAIFEALFAKLDLMEEFWSVPKMAAWIQEIHGKAIPEQTIHNRLKIGGYTFKSSRPNPYKGDPELQAAFKKTEF